MKQALNQHSSLIPTIAYSLFEIQKRSDQHIDPATSSLEAIKLGLWKLAQRQLFNANASSRLSPLIDRLSISTADENIGKVSDSFDAVWEDFQDIDDGEDHTDTDSETLSQIEEFFALDMDSVGEDSAGDEEREMMDICVGFHALSSSPPAG